MPEDTGGGCGKGLEGGRADGVRGMEVGLVASAEGESGDGGAAAGFPPRAAHSSGVGC